MVSLSISFMGFHHSENSNPFSLPLIAGNHRGLSYWWCFISITTSATVNTSNLVSFKLISLPHIQMDSQPHADMFHIGTCSSVCQPSLSISVLMWPADTQAARQAVLLAECPCYMLHPDLISCLKGRGHRVETWGPSLTGPRIPCIKAEKGHARRASPFNPLIRIIQRESSKLPWINSLRAALWDGSINISISVAYGTTLQATIWKKSFEH